MKSFEGRLAVITGGGTGMGRELAVQLAAEGCSVALCDVSEENATRTRETLDRFFLFAPSPGSLNLGFQKFQVIR